MTEVEKNMATARSRITAVNLFILLPLSSSELTRISGHEYESLLRISTIRFAGIIRTSWKLKPADYWKYMLFTKCGEKRTAPRWNSGELDGSHNE